MQLPSFNQIIGSILALGTLVILAAYLFMHSDNTSATNIIIGALISVLAAANREFLLAAASNILNPTPPKPPIPTPTPTSPSTSNIDNQPKV